MTERTIDWDHFAAVDLRVGRVTNARVNTKARKPALVLEIDFGAAGTRMVADVRSEVLVLGTVDDDGVVLLRPDVEVPPGTRVA